ncbi:ABC transporter substrate-binding protein [soil metagenome]
MSRVTSTARRRVTVKRALVTAVGILSASAILAGCASSSSTTGSSASGSASTTLSGTAVWADYGGPTHAARQKVFLDPFSKSTGVTVTSTTIADAVLTKMLDGGAGDYDVVQASVSDVYNHKANLVKLPASAKVNDLLPADVQRYALGTFNVGEAQGFLTSTFSNGGPTNWADFWDFKKFPGKRGIPGTAGSFDYMFEAALMADGVAPADLYPLDIPRAIKKLDELKGHIVFYTEYPQMQQLLASGSASIVFGPSGQFAALSAAGSPTSINWNQALEAQNIFVIPKGAPNKANAIALASYFADPKREAAFADITNYGPGNEAALQYVSKKAIGNLPNAPVNDGKVIAVNVKSRAASFDKLLAAYGSWLATAQ